MSACFICSSCSWYTWISASSVQTLVGRSAVVWRNSSKKAARILFVFTSSKSWVLTNLWVLNMLPSSTCISSFKIKLFFFFFFFFFSHMTLPPLHPSPQFLVVSYLMASIEMPGLMMKLLLVDPRVHQLGSKRAAVGAAFLHQVCPSGCDPQKNSALSGSFASGLTIAHWRKEACPCTQWFYNCFGTDWRLQAFLRRSQEQNACI